MEKSFRLFRYFEILLISILALGLLLVLVLLWYSGLFIPFLFVCIVTFILYFLYFQKFWFGRVSIHNNFIILKLGTYSRRWDLDNISSIELNEIKSKGPVWYECKIESNNKIDTFFGTNNLLWDYLKQVKKSENILVKGSFLL